MIKVCSVAVLIVSFMYLSFTSFTYFHTDTGVVWGWTFCMILQACNWQGHREISEHEVDIWSWWPRDPEYPQDQLLYINAVPSWLEEWKIKASRDTLCLPDLQVKSTTQREVKKFDHLVIYVKHCVCVDTRQFEVVSSSVCSEVKPSFKILIPF